MPLTLPHHTTHHITSLHHTITYHPIHQYLSLHKPSVTPNTIHFQHSSPSWCWTFPITLTTKSKQNPAVTSPTNRNFQPLTFFFLVFLVYLACLSFPLFRIIESTFVPPLALALPLSSSSLISPPARPRLLAKGLKAAPTSPPQPRCFIAA